MTETEHLQDALQRLVDQEESIGWTAKTVREARKARAHHRAKQLEPKPGGQDERGRPGGQP
jgi:hypothetical protein